VEAEDGGLGALEVALEDLLALLHLLHELGLEFVHGLAAGLDQTGDVAGGTEDGPAFFELLAGEAVVELLYHLVVLKALVDLFPDLLESLVEGAEVEGEVSELLYVLGLCVDALLDGLVLGVGDEDALSDALGDVVYQVVYQRPVYLPQLHLDRPAVNLEKTHLHFLWN
jgi:hypothetical protein